MLRRLANWLSKVSLVGHSGDLARVAPAVPAAPLPPRLTLDEQWERARARAVAKGDSAELSRAFQASAASRLDSVAYALDRLRLDLSSIMTMPEQKPEPVAAIHRLEPARRVTLAEKQLADKVRAARAA